MKRSRNPSPAQQTSRYARKTNRKTDNRFFCFRLPKCPNGKCLVKSQVCDGKNDCDEAKSSDTTTTTTSSSFDESKCRFRPNVQIKLVGGKGNHEGNIMIKSFQSDFGGLCDDGFNIDEANVICRYVRKYAMLCKQ